MTDAQPRLQCIRRPFQYVLRWSFAVSRLCEDVRTAILASLSNPAITC